MSDLIPVAEALAALFRQAEPLPPEDVPLDQAAGRVLAADAVAQRNQPPFSTSSMDGYAVRGEEVRVGAGFDVIGEAAAGHSFAGQVREGQAVRIFTGAPLPKGADWIVIQEDVDRQGDRITVTDGVEQRDHVRPEGGDFKVGDMLPAPRRLSPSDIALLASMNVAMVRVYRQPDVAIIATGDELVMPGETPNPDQIIASNSFGLKAMFEAEGAKTRLLPIAKDTVASLETVLDLAKDADLIITIGGASVGDYDLVAQVATSLGLERSFYKVAMRPGKPLMSGRLGRSMLVGLPGNPVSSMVCGTIFVVPTLRALQGLPAQPCPTFHGTLGRDLGPNGPREHYMRAALRFEDGEAVISPEDRQDSSLVSVLAHADCLMVRPPHDPALKTGTSVRYIPL